MPESLYSASPTSSKQGRLAPCLTGAGPLWAAIVVTTSGPSISENDLPCSPLEAAAPPIAALRDNHLFNHLITKEYDAPQS
jgi:hypothetical protein